MKQEIKDKIIKVRNAFIREDEKEPFSNRKYVDAYIKTADILFNSNGDLPMATDRAIYDFIDDLLKEVQND